MLSHPYLGHTVYVILPAKDAMFEGNRIIMGFYLAAKQLRRFVLLLKNLYTYISYSLMQDWANVPERLQ